MLPFLDLKDNGDRRSLFERLYGDYKDEMLRLAMQELMDPGEAEDVVHDVFVYFASKSMRRLERSTETDRRYLLLLTARHRAINQRKKLNRSIPSEDAAGGTTELSDREFMRILEQHEAAARLDAMLAEIPIIYRDVLYLRFVNALKGKDIAELIGISEGAVWKRIERGKKLLLEELKKEENE